MKNYISLIEALTVIESTNDCLIHLNAYKPGKWKRTKKFNLKIQGEDDHVVRVFTNGKEFVTIIEIGYEEVIMCENLDLGAYKDLIDEITKLSKKYFTYDYGEIWYNPWEKKVIVVGGDCGIYYHETKTPKQIANDMDSGKFDEDSKTPLFHEKITKLKDSTFEAEHSPEPYYKDDEINDHNRDEVNYICIGSINDLGYA